MADTNKDGSARAADASADAVAAVADAVKAVPQAAAKATDAAADTVSKTVDAVVAAAPAPAPATRKTPVRAAAKRAPARAATRTARAATKAAAPAKPVKAKPARKAAPAVAAVATKTSEAPKRVSAPAAAKTNQTAFQGNINMKNETKQAADRFQAVFGDVNERAKTLVERNTRIAEEFTELSKGNVEAVVASTKVAAKGVETLGQELAEFNRKSFEDASAALQRFAEVKSPTDFFRLQSEFARGQFDALVAETSKLSETMLKVAGEVAEPITSRYSVAAERVRTVVAA